MKMYSKIFSQQIPSNQLVDDIKKAIAIIYALPAEEYNSNLFHDIAVGFKSIVINMESTSCAFPLFLKWLKLYVELTYTRFFKVASANALMNGRIKRLQHQIDPKNENLFNKFERRIPVCTSYIVASLQYQTRIANYHLQVMEMCLSLFNCTSPDVMKIIANMDINIIPLCWMPIEFAGDYNTQKLSLKLIVKILRYLQDSEIRMKIAELETSPDIRNLLLRLTIDESNFEKISRELLNKFNMESTHNCAVYSVYCTTVFFGGFELFKPKKVDKFWIDFNYTSKSVSFVCQFKQHDGTLADVSIQIKIDKLQIENQFDCIVISIEPAIFSTRVSTELKNARVAVFNLPENEVERLKANRDILDFYNCSYSESDIAHTPNTIENYLAEENTWDRELLQILRLEDSQVPCDSQVILPELSMTDISKESQKAPAVKESVNIVEPIKERDTTFPVSQNTLPSRTNLLAKELPNSASSNKESGYNTGSATVKRNLTVFKKPTEQVGKQDTSSEKASRSVQHSPKPGNTSRRILTANTTKRTNSKSALSNKESGYNTDLSTKPVRQKRKRDTSSEKTSKSVHSSKPKRKSSPVHENTIPLASQSTQSITLTGNTSRRFFKADTTKKAVSLPKKPKRTYRKKAAYTVGISPKRKQVNTVKPLNHLVEPDGDPEEAAVEYVENGGYANIIRFLRSDAGANCFSEQQKKQILENIERINGDIERSTERFFQKNASSDTDSGSTQEPTVGRRQSKTVPKVSDFIPLSTYNSKLAEEKAKGQFKTISSQKEHGKEVSVSINPTEALDAFDQMKFSSSNPNFTSSKAIMSNKNASSNKTIIADNRSLNGSESSYSNHNFHIAESDGDLVEATSDDETRLDDMVCRQEPEQVELSPFQVPIEVSQMKVKTPQYTPQTSSGSNWLDIVRPTPYPAGGEVISQLERSYQMSEIFEDLDEIPPCNPPDREESIFFSDSEQSQVMSLDSLSTSEESSINNHSQAGLETTSRQNQYQPHQPYNQSKSRVSPNCIDSISDSHPNPPEYSSEHRPQNIMTNQVIIQNQFFVSTVRKRMIAADDDESPLAKIRSGEDRVPLRGYADLVQEYKKLVTIEKNRLLKKLEDKLQVDIFDNYSEIADEVMTVLTRIKTSVNEAQEGLSSLYGKLEWFIENQQKQGAFVESAYFRTIGHIRASYPKREEIEEAYAEIANELKKYSTNLASELWQDYANKVVSQIEDRLKGLTRL